MNETLQKVVAAMAANLREQIDGDWETHPTMNEAGPSDTPTSVYIDGRFDLEQVARAGLKAIKDPTPAMLQAAEQHKWGSPAESYAVDVPSLFSEMIGEILK